MTMSSTARTALADVWAGREVTIISSPPGAGKTETITSIAPHLACDADLSVVVACPTIAGAYDMAVRLHKKIGRRGHVVLAGSSFHPNRARGVTVDQTITPTAGRVIVKTVAGMRFSKDPVDVLIIDEAFQVTALDARQALAHCSQVLLVGDPGQIGPVVTIDTQAWDSSPLSPAKPAPVVFGRWSGAATHHLSYSYRLGVKSVQVVRSFYDFSFESARPPAAIDGVGEIECVNFPSVSSYVDTVMLQTALRRARELIGRSYVYDGVERPLEGTDIVVLASRNEQVSMLEAYIASDPELAGVNVGTADSRQGGQWPAAIVVDPLAGATTVSSHAVNAGRLCVMLSRHIAHVSFITSNDVEQIITQSDMSKTDKLLHVQVRRRIKDLSRT